jgi:hypothetical protein
MANTKTRKVFLKQFRSIGMTEYEVIKTVDAGTEFAIGSTLDAKKVDTLAFSSRYSVTIS